MIKIDFFITRDDGVDLYRTYSTDDYYIMQEQTLRIYDEAIDVENSGFTYIETGEKIIREEAELIGSIPFDF